MFRYPTPVLYINPLSLPTRSFKLYLHLMTFFCPLLAQLGLVLLVLALHCRFIYSLPLFPLLAGFYCVFFYVLGEPLLCCFHIYHVFQG